MGVGVGGGGHNLCFYQEQKFKSEKKLSNRYNQNPIFCEVLRTS